MKSDAPLPLRSLSTPAVAREEQRQPTRRDQIVFRLKATGLQALRAYRNLSPGAPGRLLRGAPLDHPFVIAESRSPLWTDESLAERSLQWGKAENLRIALRLLDGTAIPGGELFSFWKQIGRPVRSRGFVAGRELREGCVIPAVGGGICQLSNALYEVALQAGCEIVERHAHSRVVPGSAAAAGRDATVFWNYVDLRWRASCDLLLEARLTRDELIVRLRGRATPAIVEQPPRAAPQVTPETPPAKSHGPGSCMSCGVESCFRHASREARVLRGDTGVLEGRTAFLLDECWPEFRRYVAKAAAPDRSDLLLIALDGTRRNRSRYAWPTEHFGQVRESVWETGWRAWGVRRLAKTGAAGGVRRRLEMERTGAIAARLATALRFDVTQLVVSQSLLPFLWRDGYLGGRTFRVLMTRLPMRELHRRLDAASTAHPDRDSLADFRAPEELVRAEEEALSAADEIITPHAEIAALYPVTAGKLAWDSPPAPVAPAVGAVRPGPVPGESPDRAILFPGPTAARKGAWEVREVARRLGLSVVLSGAELEGPEFWTGVRTRRMSSGSLREEGIGAVVLPAVVEDQPRLLLRARSEGIPVIATAACGLEAEPGVILIAQGDADALQAAVEEAIRPVQLSR